MTAFRNDSQLLQTCFHFFMKNCTPAQYEHGRSCGKKQIQDQINVSFNKDSHIISNITAFRNDNQLLQTCFYFFMKNCTI